MQARTVTRLSNARRRVAVQNLLALLQGVLLALLLWLPASVLAEPTAADRSPARELQVFVRDGCPHCHDAKVFLDSLAPGQLGDVRVVFRDVVADPEARKDLERATAAAGVAHPGVPTFVFGETVIIGFDDAQRTGQRVLDVVLAGQTPPATASAVNTRWFGTLSASQLGLPLFTLAIGLLDGFNPCATWVLLFLLSLLVRLQDRRRMILISGCFVLASGAVYYAFMAAWLNVFLAFRLTNTLRLGLAALALLIGALNVKDFFAFGQGPSLSIPAAAKPKIYERMRAVINAPSLGLALVSVTALALVVNLVELLCTAGFPAIYTAILTQHDVGTAGRYAYLGLYIVGYMADDTLMVALAVAAINRYRLTETAGRHLKLLAGGMMLLLGLVLLLRPGWVM